MLDKILEWLGLSGLETETQEVAMFRIKKY